MVSFTTWLLSKKRGGKKHQNIHFQVNIAEDGTILFEEALMNCHWTKQSGIQCLYSVEAAVWWLLIVCFFSVKIKVLALQKDRFKYFFRLVHLKEGTAQIKKYN